MRSEEDYVLGLPDSRVHSVTDIPGGTFAAKCYVILAIIRNCRQAERVGCLTCGANLLILVMVRRVVICGRGDRGLVCLADRRRGGRGGASGVGAELDRRRCRGLQSGWVQSAFTSQRKERKNAENISPTCITFSKSVRKFYFPLER